MFGESASAARQCGQNVIDLGDEIFDAFCAGTNSAASCTPDEVTAVAAPVLTDGMVAQPSSTSRCRRAR